MEPASEQGFQPEPAQAHPPAEAPIIPDPTPTDNSVNDEHMNGIGLEGNTSAGWNGFQGNEGMANNFQNPPVEEPRPIGIKEDG